MRQITTALALACLTFMSRDTASAQQVQVPATPAEQLTLQEAIERALARNPDLAVTGRDVDISRGRLLQARRYPFNPELGLDGDAGRGRGRENGARRGVGGGAARLSQVVEIRGQRGLRVQAGQSDLARTEWELRDRQREVVAETTRAFGDLLVAQEQLGLAREVVALTTELRRTASALAEAGEVPEVDVVRAEVEVRRATNRLTLAEVSVATAGRTLALLIGAPGGTALRASGPLLFDPLGSRPNDLLGSARALRPDLKAAEAAVQNAFASLRLVRAERFVPALTLSVGYGEALDFDAINRTVTFGVSIPLPLWNRRDGDLAAAEAELRKREAERDRIVARIETEVPTAFGQFTAAQRVVDEYINRVVPGQEQSVRLILEGYRLGEFRLTEALQAQRDLIDVRTAYLEAIAAYNVARADLQRAAGLRP